jgi:hypothetical protein
VNFEVMPRSLLLDGTDEQSIPDSRKNVDTVNEH